MAALLAHGPAGLEGFISMTSGGGHASDEAWSKATRIARELDRILDGAAPVREAVMRAASELRLSTRQVYNHLARYREERRVSSLLPRTSGTRNRRRDRYGNPRGQVLCLLWRRSLIGVAHARCELYILLTRMCRTGTPQEGLGKPTASSGLCVGGRGLHSVWCQRPRAVYPNTSTGTCRAAQCPVQCQLETPQVCQST